MLEHLIVIIDSEVIVKIEVVGCHSVIYSNMITYTMILLVKETLIEL